MSRSQKLTDKIIDALAAKPKPYEVRDAELVGFLVRVEPSGTKNLYCNYDRGCRVRLCRFGEMPTAQARQAARRVKQASTLAKLEQKIAGLMANQKAVSV